VAVEDGSFDKSVLRFNDDTLLSINATNAKTLLRAYGEESDDWVGKMVELYIGSTSYQGQPKDSILIKAISPATPIAERTAPKPVDPDAKGREIDDAIPFQRTVSLIPPTSAAGSCGRSFTPDFAGLCKGGEGLMTKPGTGLNRDGICSAHAR
jgi:hypothetical protein